MRRRTLLAGLTASVAAACAAKVAESPSPRASTSGTIAPPIPSPAATTTARPGDLASLRASLRGALVLPSAAEYDGARVLYNTRFDAIRPQAIARCSSPGDVQACVRFARESGMPLALRSGGHSYAGWSTGSGLIVDTAALNAIAVSDDTVTVGAGAKLIDVYDALAARGRGIAAGSCPTVGIAGLTLGGGVGVLTRAWGLTCDQLTSAEIVTADGVARRCDARSEPDLFWALRGAGGGSFGVVTSLTLATHAVETLALGTLTWPWTDARAVVAGWQRWMASAPEALWSTLHLAGGAEPSVSVHAVYPASATAIAAELTRLAGLVGRGASYRESGALSYRDVMLLEAGCVGRSPTACHLRAATAAGELERETFAAVSVVAPDQLSDAAVAVLIDAVARAATGGGTAILIDSLGGAVARIAPEATAFPHRSAFAIVQLYASWGQGDSGDASLAWLRTTQSAARAQIGSGAYVNYADPSLTDWPAAYYGANYARLRQVKRAYDPDRLFDFPQAIVPA